LDLAAKNGEDWRSRLGEVAALDAEWVRLVPRWAEIEAAYREDEAAQHRAHGGDMPPSRCWWLVSTIQGCGDPYRRMRPHPFRGSP
jgi:maltooligosyltrehalose synthase